MTFGRRPGLGGCAPRMCARTKDEDLPLVERFLGAPEGDTRAFEALVRKHTRKVVANCRYITRSAADAEDLAQDVFVKAYFGLRKFEGRSSFRTWLNRIKVNHCLNHLKRVANQTVVHADDATLEAHTAAAEPSSLPIDPDPDTDRAEIERILDSMSDTLRIPLLLRDMDELSYQEIADALGIGLSAVKMRIKRGREEFRRQYPRRSPAPGADA